MSERDAAREAFHQALARDDPAILYESAPVGYLSTTPDGAIVKVNQTFLSWTGHSRESLVGERSFVDLLSPGGRIFHETHYAPLLRMQGSVREIALDIMTAEGGRIPVLVNANVDRDDAGRPVVVRIALFDATERRSYERELVAARQRAEDSEQKARELARTLQQALIPPSLPDIPGLEVSADFHAGVEEIEVGGDFYDVVAVGRDDWLVVIGDVCGKGVEAAGISALARHTLRAVAVGLHAPSQALHALNDVLLSHESGRFCTVSVIRLQRHGLDWIAQLGSAGHPPPILLRTGEEPMPCGGTGPLLGVFEAPTFEDERVILRPGDRIVLYTDGVTEGRRGKELFGDERLLEHLAKHGDSAAEIVSSLVEVVTDFQSGQLSDDVAVVALGVPQG